MKFGFRRNNRYPKNISRDIWVLPIVIFVLLCIIASGFGIVTMMFNIFGWQIFLGIFIGYYLRRIVLSL